MRKKSVMVIAIIVVFSGGFLLGTGFQKRTDMNLCYRKIVIQANG